MGESWFVEQKNGTVSGPMPEKLVREDLLSGRISPDLRVRQGIGGPWCLAGKVRDIFRNLTETGWFIQSQEEVFGPFTADRLLQLHRAGEVSQQAKLRQGLHGPWNHAEDLFAIWTQPNQQTAATPEREEPKWIIEPIRHYKLPVGSANQEVIDACQTHEHLLLESSGKNQRLALLRSNHRILGYLSRANSDQLIANSRRGIRHIILLSESSPPEVTVVLCPPGVKRDECRLYISTKLVPPSTESRSID